MKHATFEQRGWLTFRSIRRYLMAYLPPSSVTSEQPQVSTPRGVRSLIRLNLLFNYFLPALINSQVHTDAICAIKNARTSSPPEAHSSGEQQMVSEMIQQLETDTFLLFILLPEKDTGGRLSGGKIKRFETWTCFFCGSLWGWAICMDARPER
ncbi:hypothetical protein AVEN_214909-1 [Araneus ventricosus]|uniref:Uncharacterized protein n=1 Tax=Araneus ventricosus TaxID=182803 RepID=A0A4Y2V4B8_ARAVE|nr:hypothetical protein AVEN_237683-1 [Araneus ventricosus]GBO20090.1 hypothetical protein AVEN_21819-1 [Araneus ventricosus]GBO20301.1 hypothetical protein AVEN_189979-1 [Araneus ventricosus]GBO20379.1 hypothetical protein AVEN_214909-1 [Araneus ventricosus]